MPGYPGFRGDLAFRGDHGFRGDRSLAWRRAVVGPHPQRGHAVASRWHRSWPVSSVVTHTGEAPTELTRQARTAGLPPGNTSTLRRPGTRPYEASTVPHGSPDRILPQAVPEVSWTVRCQASLRQTRAQWMLPARSTPSRT